MQFNFGPNFAWSLLRAVFQAFGMLFSVWYTWVFLALIITVRIGPQIYENWRLRKAGMPEIDRMNGLEFEKFLEITFRRLGYQVQRTPYVGDQGADLILTKGGERLLVQAKRHGRAIGNKAIQEAAAARPHYNCHRAMVVANREFTGPARALAQSNHVELWGRKKLTEVLLYLDVQEARAKGGIPAAKVTPTPIVGSQAPAPTPPICPNCQQPMVLRNGPRGQFWGCPRYPRCRHTAQLYSHVQ